VFAFLALIIIIVRRRLRQKRKEKEDGRREAELLSAYLAIHNIVLPDDEEDDEVAVVLRGFTQWRAAQLVAEEAANRVPDNVTIDYPLEDGVEEVELEVVDVADVPQQPPAVGMANRLMALMVSEIAKETSK